MPDIKFYNDTDGEFDSKNPLVTKIKKVKSLKNSKWLRDEIIITLDFYQIVKNHSNIKCP